MHDLYDFSLAFMLSEMKRESKMYMTIMYMCATALLGVCVCVCAHAFLQQLKLVRCLVKEQTNYKTCAKPSVYSSHYINV